MSISNKGQQLLQDGDWLEAIEWFLTQGGDPTLQLVMPTAIYGGALLGLFIYSSSVVLPMSIAIILGGVILSAFPSSALTVIVLGTLFALAAAGQLLTFRSGR
jgi:hypothetical protein